MKTTFQSLVLRFALGASLASCGGAEGAITVNEATTDSSVPSGDDGADGGAITHDGSIVGDDDGGQTAVDSGAPGKDGGAQPSPDAGPIGSTGVTIIVEPSDKGAALLAAIKGATTSIHMTMYLLSSTDITSALVAAKKKGLEVKVVLNQTFPSGGGSNATPFTTLKNGGVDVVYAPAAYTYTHEKCVILDGKEAWIMTMNATFTSPTANREYLAVDHDAADIQEAEQIFQADFANKAITPVGNLLVAPVNARNKLVALIASAVQTIDVEGEEFSDTKIAAALAQKAQAGTKVRVVVASGSSSATQAQAIATVKAAGVLVVGQSNPYIHAKALVVDGSRAYVGSENFSTGSLVYNRELGLIVDTASEVAKVAAAIATDFSTGTAQ